MAKRENFNASKVARMSTVFPQAVKAGDFVFLSGMAGIDPVTGVLVSDRFEEQVRQCFENIKTVLEEAGTSMSKMVRTTIYMVAGNDFSTINKVYTEFFPENAPARSAPQVMPFPGGILVSVECIALQ